MQSVNLPLSLRTAGLLSHATDATLCIWQKASSMWSLLPGALRGMQGSIRHSAGSQSTWGCQDQEVPIPSPPLTQNPPTDRAEPLRAPLWAIQTQDQEKSLKKPYKRTEIYETDNRAMQKHQDIHALEFQIWNTPFTCTRQCSLFSIEI